MASPTSGLKDKLGGSWSTKFISIPVVSNNGTPIALKTERNDAGLMIATSLPLGNSLYPIFNLIASSPPRRELPNKFVIEVNSAPVVFPPLD